MEYDGQSQMDDLDFADDLALLSHTQKQTQEKTNIVREHSAPRGLNIHRGKSKILKLNSTRTASVPLGVEAMEEVDHFTYLGSVVDTQGRTEADVKARIGKARVTFLQLKNI